MYKEIYELIMKVEFNKAEMIFKRMKDEEKKELIEQLVYDTESMIVYAFIQYLNEKQEEILYHEIEFDILTNALCHIEGAYQMALMHNQRLLELVPNSIKYMEWMLVFYGVGVIDKERTISIAKKILEYDEENLNAKHLLEEIQ